MFHKLTDADENPIIYPNTFERGTTSGPDRLVIAPRGDQVDLLCLLLSLMAGPFAFLYILVVTRTGQEEARYQLDATLSLEEITTLLREYRDFFEYDARHIIYLYSFDDDATLVYDRHNLIYAYGNLDRYTACLSQAGYFPATVQVPTPHAHHYHKQFDDCETRLIDSNKWSISGLRDIDLA